MLNILGTILIITAIALSALVFLRPKIFKRQDIVLIVVFIICGIILLSQGSIYDQLPQIILMLLTATAVSYTIDSLRLRSRKN
ncbi:Ycf66 family protein [Scytonema sp. NUACC26]|uniref:Ycf66 family protein n=1 Tax=Scytonema sp. NUACC26 TaxID=3140176 RepID=UPI0034DC4727